MNNNNGEDNLSSSGKFPWRFELMHEDTRVADCHIADGNLWIDNGNWSSSLSLGEDWSTIQPMVDVMSRVHELATEGKYTDAHGNWIGNVENKPSEISANFKGDLPIRITLETNDVKTANLTFWSGAFFLCLVCDRDSIQQFGKWIAECPEGDSLNR